MGFSLDAQFQSSSNPGAAVVSRMHNDCEPTTGAWSCHVGHWYALTVPSSGINSTKVTDIEFAGQGIG